MTVPGAEYEELAHLDDLTTTGTVASGHTNPADYVGVTHAGLPTVPAVPGTQIDGYFPDTSHTNTNHGWNHDAQFVIRLPREWNGGLVVSGAPGVRAQYSNDLAISDHVLSLGYAYACTDKGNTGIEFYKDSKQPGDALVEWNERVTELARAARETVEKHYGQPADEVIAAGASNGGYLVRWQLENHPELYTRGVDLEGTLWSSDLNPLSALPSAIRGYEQQSPALVTAPGFDPASDFLWEYHYTVYWTLTQRIYIRELDPSYQGSEADYDYSQRPDAQEAIRRFGLTGNIGKPLHSIHGTYDCLLPITQSDRYAELARSTGLHTYQRVEAGNHLDGLVDAHPDRLVPLVPLLREAISTPS
ncbi:pimeloyl-ACP methyl ester carboxylesterase [Kribbella rubisoli]|uniref:Pimeloyl-ACP methyl ester carboxylesterase n=1 Tax=Kribbella rubisoli TaxID=3075929 RepID=A0A4Q7WUH4_9ACTN|nr:alpha/beta hydrolase [Kribbella rubisoli]RZU14052.1 pimeloyl-ACP methyl ester carboxylesterase [Kribbella rubisoli]